MRNSPSNFRTLGELRRKLTPLQVAPHFLNHIVQSRELLQPVHCTSLLALGWTLITIISILKASFLIFVD